MSTKIALSNNANCAAAAKELQTAVGNGPHKLVIFFASSSYDPNELARDVQRAFGKTPTFGCTTAGEISSGQMAKSSVVAMALGDDLVEDVSVAWVDAAKARASVTDAMQTFADHFKTPVAKMSHEKYLGLVLTDGLSCAEELVNEAINDKTNVPFVGGSAGDDVKFKSTFVFANGEARGGVAGLALLSTKVPFEILKTQSFKPLAAKLKVTRADVAKRTVHEFNNKPAVQAYAEALKTTPADLPNHFMSRPLGLMVSATEPFVRSPQQVSGQSVVFYCAIKEGMELSVLESGDIVADTAKALDAAKSRGPISAIINFHCILRTLELESKKTTQPYADLFKSVPTIGFSTYGESFLGHINQTSTMVLFRDA